MKKIIALTLSALTVSSVSHAGLFSRRKPQPAPMRIVSVQECSENLYINLSTYESSTDRACSYGATNSEFQDCVIDSVGQLGANSNNREMYSWLVETSGFMCSRSREYAQCVIDLDKQGGLSITNSRNTLDGFEVCKLGEREQIKNCIIDNYQRGSGSSDVIANFCIEQFDPVARARKEAEQRRIEEARRAREIAARAAEQRRQEDLRRQQEQQRIAADQRRAEEQRRLEEQRRQQQQQTQPVPVPTKKPQVNMEPAPLPLPPAKNQDEQKRLDEQRRQQQQKDAQRAEEERKRQEAERNKKAEEDKKKKEQQSSSPSSEPSNPPPTDGGVIVDLPNFN